MTPEENDLRRALEARSGNPSPQFRARLSTALAEGKPASNMLPALALVAALVLTFATVGVLLLARQARSVRPPTPVSVATPSPTSPSTAGVLVKPAHPIVLPASAQLSAASTNVVWALVVNQYLYRSTDRGVTWEQRPLPPNTGGFSQPVISFVTDGEGWLSTGGAAATQCSFESTAVWHTTDAGATWQLLGSNGIQGSQCKNGLSFVDSNRGFLDAGDPNFAPVIYRTTNGGRTWTASRPLPDPPGFKTQAGGFTLQAGLVRAFGSTLLVPAVGAQSGVQVQYVFRSTDGGATWTYLHTGPIGDGTLALVTASRWIQLASPGLTRQTTDGGASWHLYSSDYSQAAPVAPEIVFGDSMVGYATVRGGISRTVDGGLHWTSVQTPGTAVKSSPKPAPPSTATTLHPESVTFISPEVGLVIGLSPCGGAQCLRLAKTVDAGVRWTWVTSNLSGISPAHQWRMRFADAENGWISGPLLFATHNGGRTWTRIALPGLGSTYGSVSALEATDGRVFAEVVEGTNQNSSAPPVVLFSSKVSSNSWQGVGNVASGSSGEISIAQGTIWVMQGHLRLYRSSDGVSWHSSPQPCPSNSYNGASVAAATSSRVFIVCAGAGAAGSEAKTVYLSTNGGASYLRLGDAPLSGQFEEAAASPLGVAVAALSGATYIYTSFNDGQTWSTTLLPESDGLSNLGFTTSTQGVVIFHGAAYPQLLMTRDGGHTWKAVDV